MHKFKPEDKVKLKDNCTIPTHSKSLAQWGLPNGSIHEVRSVGEYSWGGKQFKVVSLQNNAIGYIPEDFFDLYIETSTKFELPKNWAYKLTEEDCAIVWEWRQDQKLSGTYKEHIMYPGQHIVPTWYDGSGYSLSSAFPSDDYVLLTKEQFYEHVINPWQTTRKPHPKPVVPKLVPVTFAHTGAKVIGGKDWDWGNQGEGEIGTITEHSSNGWVSVQWATSSNSYRVGAGGKYDLYYDPQWLLAHPNPTISVPTTLFKNEITPPSVPDLEEKVSVKDFSQPSTFPRLILKNSKKSKLLSAAVDDFNVNLNLKIKT